MSQIDSFDEIGWGTDFELTEFNYSILCLLAEESTYGLGIKRRLQEYYGYEINHGKLYPNLDDLAEAGLIEKGMIDDRTNEYSLTDEGLRVALDRVQWLLHHLIGDEERAVELVLEIEELILDT